MRSALAVVCLVVSVAWVPAMLASPTPDLKVGPTGRDVAASALSAGPTFRSGDALGVGPTFRSGDALGVGPTFRSGDALGAGPTFRSGDALGVGPTFRSGEL